MIHIWEETDIVEGTEFILVGKKAIIVRENGDDTHFRILDTNYFLLGRSISKKQMADTLTTLGAELFNAVR